MSSCEVEDTKPKDPCEGITCNNGVCFDGGCRCNKGYTGANCATKVAPKDVMITAIKILRFPALNNGSSWDNTSTGRPDLWLRVFRFTSLVHEQNGSSAISNATSVNENIYTPPSRIRLTEVEDEHIIALYDYDGDPASNTPDFMGEAKFTPFLSSRDGFPTTITVDEGGDVAFELTVYYEF